jgi:hypothetical protein
MSRLSPISVLDSGRRSRSKSSNRAAMRATEREASDINKIRI